MAQIHRLDCNNDTRVGGVLIVFPEMDGIELSWIRNAPILDTLEGAKKLAAEVLDKLLAQGLNERANSVNWASVAAAIKKHLDDWNVLRKASLYAESSPGLSH